MPIRLDTAPASISDPAGSSGPRHSGSMCLQIVLWAGLLGFAGGFGGVMLAVTLYPSSAAAPAVGLIAGAVLGAAFGAGGVLLMTPRRPGD